MTELKRGDVLITDLLPKVKGTKFLFYVKVSSHSYIQEVVLRRNELHAYAICIKNG